MNILRYLENVFPIFLVLLSCTVYTQRVAHAQIKSDKKTNKLPHVAAEPRESSYYNCSFCAALSTEPCIPYCYNDFPDTGQTVWIYECGSKDTCTVTYFQDDYLYKVVFESEGEIAVHYYSHEKPL